MTTITITQILAVWVLNTVLAGVMYVSWRVLERKRRRSHDAVWEQLWQDTTEVTGPRQRTAEIRELNEMWRRS